MPCTWPSTRTRPSEAGTCTTAQATPSANTALRMISSVSSTLRYTSSRMTSTVTSATAGSSPSMPAKASDRSARLAAGPAGCTLVPGTCPAASRTRCRTAGSRSPRSGRSGTTACSACLSAEATGGDAAGPAGAGSSASEVSALAACGCTWATDPPSRPVHTTIAGRDSRCRNASCSRSTRVDSHCAAGTPPGHWAPPPRAAPRTARTRRPRRASRRAARGGRAGGHGVERTSLCTDRISSALQGTESVPVEHQPAYGCPVPFGCTRPHPARPRRPVTRPDRPHCRIRPPGSHGRE